MWVLGREAGRRLDRLAVERYGIPSMILMENAASGVAERALAMLEAVPTRGAVVLTGPGNNGGDGFAAARHLANRGVEVRIVAAVDPDRLKGDAALNARIAARMGIRVDALDAARAAAELEQEGCLVIDALLGTGISDAPKAPLDALISVVNRLHGPSHPVLAVDVPSGLDCENGKPAGGGRAVEADETVTFVAPKPGFLPLEAQRWTGEVWVAGIGAPASLVQELGCFVGWRHPGGGSDAGPPRDSREGVPEGPGRPDRGRSD